MTVRRMLVATTGGTFGMVRSDRFFAADADQRGLLAAAVGELPGWQVDVEVVGSAGDSADATPDTWFAIAAHLERRAPACDAVVLIHGTDTLAYTAAALALLWPEDAPPLIVTGSQVPLSEPGGDALDNLRLATQVAALSSAGEVLVAFGGTVLPAFGVTKVSAQDARAFVSPVAHSSEVVGSGAPVPLSPPVAELVVAARMLLSSPAAATTPPAPTVFVLAAFPGLDAELVRRVVSPPPHAVVLECYGAGTFPLVDDELVEVLRNLTAGGTVLMCTSRCVFGEVVLGTYESGQTLRSLGAFGAGAVPTEAVVAAIHVLLRAGIPAERITALPWELPPASNPEAHEPRTTNH